MVGRVQDAAAYATKAVRFARERGERGFAAWALRLLAEIALATTAEDRYREAMALAGALEMCPLVAHCHSASQGPPARGRARAGPRKSCHRHGDVPRDEDDILAGEGGGEVVARVRPLPRLTQEAAPNEKPKSTKDDHARSADFRDFLCGDERSLVSNPAVVALRISLNSQASRRWHPPCVKHDSTRPCVHDSGCQCWP